MKLKGIYIVIFLVLFACAKGKHNEMKFDSLIWKASVSTADIMVNGKRMTLRHMMLNSLVEENLIGKSRSEIEGILGSSDYDISKLFQGVVDKSKVPHLIYSLGTSLRHPIDISVLHIWFNQEGIFLKYTVESS